MKKSKRAQKWAQVLNHPCILRDPQQRGQNQSRPKSGRICCITRAFSGVHYKGDKIKVGPKLGGNATSPLHSPGSPTKGTKSKRAQKRAELLHDHCVLGGPQTKGGKIRISCLNLAFLGAQKWAKMLHHPCIVGDPQQRGQNQSRPKRGRKCYITPAFSGSPTTGTQSKGALDSLNLAFLGAQKMGGNATSPLHSQGSPTKGTKSKRAQKRAEMLHHPCVLGGPQTKGGKIRISSLNLAFLGAQKWADMLHHPCILGDALQRGQNQSGPKRRRKCSITPALSRVPYKGDKLKRNQKWAEMRNQPCILESPLQRGQNQSKAKRGRKSYITPAFSEVPYKGDKIKERPKVGRSATSPLRSRGSPIKGTNSKQAQKWAEMLPHPCILEGPLQRGQNQSGPKRGRKYYITPAFSGVPKEAGQNQNSLPQPCLLGGPKPGGNATSPLHSRGSPTRGQNQSGPKNGQKCYITPPFSGVSKQRGAKSELAP